MKNGLTRNPDWKKGQNLRFLVQMLFGALCVWIGIEFVMFVNYHLGIWDTPAARPPGVEGFLPISALMSLWYFAQTGDVHMVHPAGTVILLAVIVLSFIFKKSFCSWLCPVGTISEAIAEVGKRIFKRNFVPWKWLDYPLRSLKYLLFAFFAWAIFTMDVESLRAFLDSPYNKVADVKMMLFFTEISRTSLIIIGVLVIGSLFIKNFWCRYLCPYGALLGVIGIFSPFRITRNSDTCTDCKLCTKACPAAIKVHKVKRVLSDECSSCMACVAACPFAKTLEMKAHRKSRFVVRPLHVGIFVAVGFVVVTGLAMLTGIWRTEVGDSEYARRIQDIDNPVYQHHYGSAPSESEKAYSGSQWREQANKAAAVE